MGYKVYFQALDSKGDNGLWVSDGTQSGTYEIGGGGNSGVSGVGPLGLTPNNLTGLGTNGLFWSTDSNSLASVWSTDGTVAGTKEVGASGGGLLSGLLGANVFTGPTAINGKVLFENLDTAYNGLALWVTDGTSAGTSEIGGAGNQGVAGGSTMHPLTVQGVMASIGNAAIFVAQDAGGASTLWRSDGTTAGTYEIGGLNNAGVANAPAAGLNPSTTGIFSLGKRAIFAAPDAAGTTGLWSTDGTAAGTYDLSDLGNLNIQGGLENIALAITSGAFSSYGGIVFFVDDAKNLWETNGTQAGTWEVGALTGTISNVTSFIGGAVYESTTGGILGIGASHGLWFTNGAANSFSEIGGANNAGVAGAPITGLSVIKSASFGNDVIFTALDSAGAVGLWITDGTAAGTSEIGGLRDAGVSGAGLTGLTPSNLTVSGGEAYFSGLDSTGHYGLWETDGTVAGTQELSNSANALLGLLATEVQNIASAAPLGDIYNGGGHVISDLSEFTNYNYFNNSGSNWDLANTNNDVFGLQNGNLSVNGANNVINFVSGTNATSLYNTNNLWDTVNGSNGAITLNNAQGSILGGGNFIYGNNGSWMSLYNTNGAWDTVTGTAQNLIMNATQSSVVGGGNNINATDFSWMSLYQTNGFWDGVNGSRDNIILNSAQAAISGGSNVIYQNGGSAMSLFQTVGQWDTVTGSGGTVILNSAQSSIFGGGNTIYGNNGVNSMSLYQTGGAWDVVYGSNDNITVNSSQATIVGNANFIFAEGANTITLAGSSDRILTGAAMGTDWILGFNATDAMTFAATNFANFSALQSHMTQSGADTVITLDSNDVITLYGVAKSSLTAAQFSFQ